MTTSRSPGPLPGEDMDRDFDFSRADFERIRKMIHAHAGIALSDAKYQLAYSRLSRRLRALRMTSFREYLDAVESGAIDEWQEFVNALTTNLTAFFREPHHFPILAEHLRRAHAARPLRIWCSAASTGEEPYSLAMTAIEAFQSDRPPVEIVATDIDTQCLRKASDGRYKLDTVDKLDRSRLTRFFLKGKGANEGWVRVRPEVQALIEFRQLNLLDARYPFREPFDAIFCRNVMIYFDKPTQHAILERFAPLLKEDGLLFCGHSENFTHARELFRLRGKTVYELVAQSGGARARAA
jgi:chemotaxis protein methyltransferase CheR